MGTSHLLLKKSTYVLAYAIQEIFSFLKRKFTEQFFGDQLFVAPSWPFKNGEDMMASSLNIYASVATIFDEFAACTP